MNKANEIKKYELYDYTGDIIAYCRFDEVESVIKELEQQKAELIEFVKDVATRNICLSFAYDRANYLLKKYSGE